MITPFDTVIRTRRRDIDRMRVAIHAEDARVIEIERESESLHEELTFESATAAGDWSISTEAFLRRRLTQRAQLHAQRIAASQDLDRLRKLANDAYGSLQALENAADGFRAEAQRRQQRAEQRSADDLSAARIARRVEPARLSLPFSDR